MNTALARELKVALVTETYPPEVNGVAATFARVVQGLAERGHRLHLVRPRQGPTDCAQPATLLWQETLVRGLPIPRYPSLRMGMPAASELARLWRQNRPDVVHIATEGPLGWSALRAARRLGLPVVSEFRTNFQAYAQHYGVGWVGQGVQAWLRHFHNRTDRTMVPTRQLASELAARGFERLSVIARGVDAQRFDPAHRDPALRAQWGASDHTRVVLCVGRIAPEKNLATVMDAWRAMRNANPDTRLVMVGDGPDRERWQRQCPDAVFAGTLRGAELARAYASADVFLFASMTETFGNVVPEAMASGLAVLAYEHAAAGELIEHGVNGQIAPLGNRCAFMRMAARLAIDAGRVERLRQQARACALSLDWQRIVSGIEGEYRATLSARRAQRPALSPNIPVQQHLPTPAAFSPWR
jgi:glycosyltransferase involved in cell wall biosynthesis